MNEQFQYMKLNMETPMANAPIVCAESPQCPAMAVLTIPINGTVMLDTMFGTAIRRISLFMSRENFRGAKILIFSAKNTTCSPLSGNGKGNYMSHNVFCCELVCGLHTHSEN